jgi:hypothetical protein
MISLFNKKISQAQCLFLRKGKQRGMSMLNLVQKFFKTSKSDKSLLRKKFSEFFFALPEHQWLNQSPTKEHFEKLFQHLPAGLLEAMTQQVPVIFVMSETVKNRPHPGHLFPNTVVVFPEFQRLLKSSKRAAVAYLAHELAFVLYELEAAQQDPLMAEVGADKFVCDIGLADELEELLLMLDETIEKRLRLTYLTVNHFTGGDNY